MVVYARTYIIWPNINLAPLVSVVNFLFYFHLCALKIRYFRFQTNKQNPKVIFFILDKLEMVSSWGSGFLRYFRLGPAELQKPRLDHQTLDECVPQGILNILYSIYNESESSVSAFTALSRGCRAQAKLPMYANTFFNRFPASYEKQSSKLKSGWIK